jgi:hypothetical protein
MVLHLGALTLLIFIDRAIAFRFRRAQTYFTPHEQELALGEEVSLSLSLSLSEQTNCEMK